MTHIIKLIFIATCAYSLLVAVCLVLLLVLVAVASRISLKDVDRYFESKNAKFDNEWEKLLADCEEEKRNG